jgi:CHAT domain-containing protein/Tfp pilus assembly protein PilF
MHGHARVFAPIARLTGVAALAICLTGATGGDVRLLRPEAPVEREISPGEAHTYEVQAGAGRYLRVAVEQTEVDLIAEVSGGGEPPFLVNSPSERQVSETISLLSREPATYRIVLRPVSGAAPGRYRIRIAELRESLPQDVLRIAAERAEAAADQMYARETRESLPLALEGYRTALERWRELGDTAKAGEILYRIGAVQRLRGESAAALEALGESRELYRRLGDRAWLATVLNQTGLVLASRGEVEPALAAYQEALGIRRELGDDATAARVLSNIGLLHHGVGRLGEARETYLQALEIFRRIGDRRREAIVLGNLGNVYQALGDPFKAREVQEETLALARSLGDRSLEAEAQNSLGLVLRQLGEPLKSLESYSAALALFRELGDRRREATALNNLARHSSAAGEWEQAVDFLQRALAIQREIGARPGEAATLTNLGRAWSALGRSPEALDAFEQALRIERATGNRGFEASTLSNLGQHLLSTGRANEAVRSLEQALKILREMGDEPGEAWVRCRLGSALRALGKTSEAAASLHDSLQRMRALSDPEGEVVALCELARTELARDAPEAALGPLDAALDIVESLRLRMAGDRLRSSYFGSLRDAYDLSVEALMRLHRRQPEAGFAARAFEMAERARARSLLDLLREARVELQHGADPRLLEEERRLRIALNAKAERQARLLETKPTAAQIEEARREVGEALAAYELAEARLRAANPGWGALVQDEGIRLPDLQALLGSETMLLEVFLGEPHSYLWTVTGSGLASFELPGREEIETAARRVHELLSAPAPRDAGPRREALAALGRMLLGPVAGKLSGQRLAVVADGALQYIPFAALPLPSGEPVLAAHEVVGLPSAAVLAELRRRSENRLPPRGTLAVLADPVFSRDDPRVHGTGGHAEPAGTAAEIERAARDTGGGDLPRLPWTREEAEAAVREAGDGPVLLAVDFKASLDTATGPEIARYRVVHFATHGLLDNRHPELSGLVLSRVGPDGKPRDGYLRLTDIYNLELQADLVVLSGCQTALGRQVRGEGLLGLTRGFFHAGASQVIASLWPVRDRATTELMQRFYRGLFHDRLRPAAALRAAQLDLRRNPRWRDPYFWAPFVAQGIW